MWRVLALLTICVEICAGANPNFTFTYEMASHCKEHHCQHGYSYDTYYSAPAPTANRSLSLEMHIAIQASSNGHILLSPVSFPETTDPVYEIVVGGGGNKFSELRRNLKRNAKASRPTDKILSAVELRGFYIKITDGGLVEFGQEGSSLPLISYFDTNPLTINYFSFAAWNGVEAKFLYDCPAPGENGTASSKIVERNLSNSDQLKKELLQDRQPTIPPGMTVTVSLEARVTSVSFNAFEAKLTTRMSLLTVWKDESLSWNPEKFHGITNTTYRQGQIWKPVFHVYNADNINSLKTIGSESISMKSTGEASFHFKAIVQTWCFTESTSYNRWPRDEYACSIVIQPWESHEQIILSTLEDVNLLDKLTDDDVIENEWEVTELRQFTVTAAKWNRLYPLQGNDTNQSDRFVISIALQRRPTNYNIAFYTPLLVLMTFVLMSFWSEPLQLSRVWFYAGATLFICMGLCFIDYLIPCHTVPTILILYMTVLGGVLLALILQVMMMTTVAEKLFKTTAMQSVLFCRCFRTVFCLPAKTNNYNTMHEGSSTLEEDDASSDIYARNSSNIEEMQPEANKYSEKKEFAEVIDKAMFVVYSIIFAAMLAAHN